MACILAVFIPTFIMKEPVRSLFMPLTLAVGFSMIASYVLSSTLVPVLTVWLMKHHGRRLTSTQIATASSTASCRPSAGSWSGSRRPAGSSCRPIWPAARLILWSRGPADRDRAVSPGRLGPVRAPLPAPPGSQYELTRRTAVRILDVIDKETRGQVAISMGYVGLAATNTSTNNMLLFMRGPDDGEFRVRLNKESGVPLAALRERLRKAVPEAIVPWLREVFEKGGLAARTGRPPGQIVLVGFRAG